MKRHATSDLLEKKLEVIGIKLFLKNPFFVIQNLYTVGRNYLYGHVLRFFVMVSLNFPPTMKISPIDDCEDVVVIMFQIRKCVFQVSFARFISYLCS